MAELSDSESSAGAPELEYGDQDGETNVTGTPRGMDDEVERRPKMVYPFEIPTSDDNLTIADPQAFHVVQDGEKDEEQIEREIDQFLFKMSDIGWRCLTDHFDAFFSLAKINSKVKNVNLCLRSVKYLLNCLEDIMDKSLKQVLKEILKAGGQHDDAIKNKATTLANHILMLIYLLNRLSVHLENEHMKRLLAMEKKKGARKIELDKQMEEWVNQRGRMIRAFAELCNVQINENGQRYPAAIRYLWRPPEANKGMIMAFIETIFKFLDNPTNKAAASQPWLETLFRLVRAICTNFEYFSRMAVALVEKTVNLEYLREATTSRYPFIQPVLNVSENRNMDLLLEHMIHHLGDMIDMDFSTTSTKPYSLLMTTMAELAPEVMIKQLSAILPYFRNDIPQFRTAVLQSFSHLLCSSQLSEKNCRQASRLFKVRQRILEFCRDHLQDENATVRSKSLQVWTALAEAKRIPAEELQKSLICHIGERLLDKSLQCRKAALQFLYVFFDGNPYGHDFNYQLHVKKLHELSMARRKLKETDPSEEPTNNAIHEFEGIRAEFEAHLFESILAHREGTVDPTLGTEAEPAEILMAIGTEIVRLPLESAQTMAALVMRGQFAEIDPNTGNENIIERCTDLCRNIFLSNRRQRREMDNEAQLHLEDRIQDYKEEMDRLSKEITQIIDKIMVAKEFSECIPNAMRAVLLGELPEMKEAMQFIVKCKQFNVQGADRAVRQMCSLIWRHNQDLHKEIMKTAEGLFVSQNRDHKIRVRSTVENLMSVLSGMKEEERACVEEVISRMAVNELPDGLAKLVWKIVEDPKHPHRRKVAIQLVAILAKADKNLRKYLRQMQALLKDKQLPPRVRAEALLAIANMSDMYRQNVPPSSQQKKNAMAFRIPANDSLFSYIESFVLEEFLRAPNERDGPVWFDVMQSALSIYYDLAKDTNAVVSHLTAKLFVIAHRITGAAEFYTQQFETNRDDSVQDIIVETKKKYTQMCCFFIERCLVLAGEIAMRTVIHIDVTWFREVKKLPEIVANIREAEKKSPIAVAPNTLLKDWEMRSAMGRGVFSYSTRDENNPHGNSDEERVRAMADNILDRRLFRNGRLLSRLLPFVVYALRAESSPPSIRDAASIAFSKFMLVSREFSERGAPMFFMLLNNSQNPVLRHNMVIASGDLCFRMPNLVEKYSQNVYTMTKDPDPMVRETAILVLTHLLTNQMLKHKSCLADVAKLITDRSSEISTLTKEFFVELGKRHIVYNLMPDFISRLSKDSREVGLQQFKIIIAFLLQQIGKDKQMDSLVDKLTTRFGSIKSDEAMTKNAKIAHYYSYCISQINLTEPAFRKMRDNLNHFATFMEDQQVYDDFRVSLERLLKNAKSLDAQTDVTEFMTQLEAIHSRGLQGDEMSRPAGRVGTRTGSRAGRGRGSSSFTRQPSARGAKRRIIESDIEEDLDEIEGD